MELTNSQKEMLLNKLNREWRLRTCPICMSTNWTIIDKVFELREFNGGDFVVGGGSILPLIPLTCNNCGYTHLINPFVTGAIPRPEENGEKK